MTATEILVWSTRDAALAEALDSDVPFVVNVRTSLDEDFNRVTAPLAKATY